MKLFSRFFYGKCWKQKSLPIVVFLLHRVPDFVMPRQRLAAFVPAGFLCGVGIIPNALREGGRQIPQGKSPFRCALSTLNFEETFFTIRQEPRWYFDPEGVLYTV